MREKEYARQLACGPGFYHNKKLLFQKSFYCDLASALLVPSAGLEPSCLKYCSGPHPWSESTTIHPTAHYQLNPPRREIPTEGLHWGMYSHGSYLHCGGPDVLIPPGLGPDQHLWARPQCRPHLAPCSACPAPLPQPRGSPCAHSPAWDTRLHLQEFCLPSRARL